MAFLRSRERKKEKVYSFFIIASTKVRVIRVSAGITGPSYALALSKNKAPRMNNHSGKNPPSRLASIGHHHLSATKITRANTFYD
jgi:hypothetical protein